MDNIFRQASKIKGHAALILITLAALALRTYMALADPFLHPWDERFHALVARNMMHHPFKPMLRANPVTDNYDPNIWCCNHIWLHKQPLFMWQMAASMKIFGVSEFTMRLPSVVMGTLMILMLYRLVILYTNNKKIALISAGLLAFSNYHMRMIGGMQGMDHNDIALGFYVLASIWAFAEYLRKPRWYWIVLVGVFSGCAILNKWLLGLLVFLGWGTYILTNFNKEFLFKKISHFVIALAVCCVVFVPWQLYILHHFPNEANFEYAFNRKHLNEVVEGHEGSIFFYLTKMPSYFGSWAWLFLFPGILISLFSKHHKRHLKVALVSEIFFVTLFFSLFVKSKVETFYFFIAPLCLIFSSIAIFELCHRIKKSYIVAAILITIAFFVLNPVQIANYLSPSNKERNDRIYNARIYKNLKSVLPSNTKVVMNMNSFEDVDVMFYNNDITAYHWLLPEEDINLMKQKKIPIAVFEPHGNYNIPESIYDYPELFIIPKKLKDF